MQVHIYLPEDNHPGHGLVRAIVKDSNDFLLGGTDYPDLTWLDSGKKLRLQLSKCLH